MQFFSCIFHERTSPISLVLSSDAEAPTWSVLHWEGQEIARRLRSTMHTRDNLVPLMDAQSTFGSFRESLDPTPSQLSELRSEGAVKVLLLH